MKKALVHDWYYVNGGAEKVIRSINNIWDDFNHFALIDFLSEEDRKLIFTGKSNKVNTSFIQNLPTAKNNHRKFLELFPLAVEQFNLNEYDLIISSSASVAKGVLSNQNQLHICYIHSPMRYAWDLYYQYLSASNLNKGLKSLYAKRVLHKMRTWDVINSNRVDHFVANSKYIAERVYKIYRREAEVIYPPVNTDGFTLETQKEDFYLIVSRLVPYKRIDLIVNAFNKMPNKKLVVIGDGPDMKKIKVIANSNIKILGALSFTELKPYMQKAKGFVFASEEDFGIVPVEAQACGTPVIGYGKGGLLETVVQGETGLFFKEQKEKDIINAINDFESIKFDYSKVRLNAEKFSTKIFESKFHNYVENKVNK